METIRQEKLNMLLYKRSSKVGRYNTYVADFETSTGNIDGSTNVYCYGISSMDKSERYIGVNLQEFFDTIYHYKIKKIYFHNTGWDTEFITHWLLENGIMYEHNPFGCPDVPNTFTRMKDNMNKVYDMKINYKGHTVQIMDTAAILLASVKDLGELLKYPKGDIDYDKYKSFDNVDQLPSELVDYLWRDVDIVIDALSRYKENFPTHGITAAGTAMKDFKKHYGKARFIKNFGGYFTDNKTKKKKLINVLTTEQWDEFKFGYRGGLTIFNEKYIGKHIKGIHGMSIDVNSLYPSVMMNEKMPIGRPYDFELYDGMLKYHKIFIKKAKRKNPEMPAFIPSNYDMSKYEVNYLADIENEYYNVWEWELERWCKGYDIEYRIVKTWYFEWEYVFTSWIKEKKSLKENATNPIDEIQIKTIINGHYGKYGQNYKRIEKEIVYDPDGELSGRRYGKYDEFVEQPVKTVNEELSYIPIASAITAYARCVLLDIVLKNIGSVLYCDTDSIYAMHGIEGAKIHQTKFGYWKPEYKFSEFKFIKPKAYLARLTHKFNKYKMEWEETDGIKRAIAGLSKENHHKINFDNFNKGQEVIGGKRQKKSVKGGLVLTDIQYTL